MNEFIEKLIGKLEENGQKMCEAKLSVLYGKHSPSNHRYYKAISVKKAIHIANQLAEEYNNDFCEWRLCDEETNVYDTTCRNPHILIEGSPTDNNYEFCPYCGKKIKVVE